MAQVISGGKKFKNDDYNLSALMKRNIFHKTRERKFEFAFNNLHEIVNQLEEKGAECE